MADLGSVRLISNTLEQFLNTWNMVLDSLTFEPDENSKCQYFYKAIEHCPHAKTEIELYDKAEDKKPPDLETFCYAFLLEAVERYIPYARKKSMKTP